MSRCFPFPPPNYCKERELIRDPRLTEPIKKEDASGSKEKRKDKKRERKEKKDKSEKSKHKDRSHKKQKLNHNDAAPITTHLDSKAQFEKSLPSTKDGYDSRATELIMNKLQTKDEKSVITEELTLRIVTPEPCGSSESTENSSMAVKANNNKHSNLRFKLPLLKHRDQKPAVAGESPCASDKNGPKVVESGPVNEAPCFPDRMTKGLKKSSAGEAAYSIGQTAANSQVLKAPPALPSNRTPSLSVQTVPKPKCTLPSPASEADRYSGHTIPEAKAEAPSSSGWTAPTPTVLKASQPNKATRILGQTPPEPKAVKATTAPSFSGFHTPKREIPKAPLARKAIPLPGFSSRVTQKPEIPKALSACKVATPVPSFSERVARKPRILNAPPASKADVNPQLLPSSKPKVLTPLAIEAPCFSHHVARNPKILNAPPASKADVNPQPLPSSKPKVLTPLANETPCFSGRTARGVSKDPLANKTPGFSGQPSKTSVVAPINEALSSSGHSNKAHVIERQPSKASVVAPINEAPSSSGHANKAHAIELEPSERRSKRSKRKHREDSDRELKKLISNWKPEPLVVHDEEDLGWLFSKSTKQSVVKADAATSDAKSCTDSQLDKLRHINPAYAFQPRAQFLPEADIYALPYVVPF